MAATPANLSVLAYRDGYTVWVYKTADLSNPDEFQSLSDLLKDGDCIHIRTPRGLAIRQIHKVHDKIILEKPL